MSEEIYLKNVRVHNLKEVSLTLPRNQLIIFSGVSGSGKSSLAFDTIFVEGQRRYIESLSTHARRQMGSMPKPDADEISGVSPTIAIEQKTAGKNPRSTVGTMTGIYDFLRVLFAKIGTPYCPVSLEKVKPQSAEEIAREIHSRFDQQKISILSPFIKEKKGELKEELALLIKRGFLRIRIDGTFYHLEDQIQLSKNSAHSIDLVIDRLKVSKEDQPRLIEAIDHALEIGGETMLVIDSDENETIFSRTSYCETSKTSYPPLDASDFSFNHPRGMCEKCLGLGVTQTFDEALIVDENLSIAEDCCFIAGSYNTVKWGNIYNYLAEEFEFSVHTPWKDLPEKAKAQFLYGNKRKWTRMRFTHPSTGKSWTEYVKWRGVVGEAKKRYGEATSDLYRKRMDSMMTMATCETCQGSRIKPYPSAARFADRTIFALTETPLEELLEFIEGVKLEGEEKLIGQDLLNEIAFRLKFLNQVGLGYLTLSRTAPTLSGGEAQRVRLAEQIGGGLVGTTYVLDEPSIGLHPSDNERLIETLKHLRDKGNTVIVVEHDEETILASDYVVDIGPGAGAEGGKILFDGPSREFLEAKDSLTADYLTKKRVIEIPKRRKRPKSKQITLKGASHHNLKGIDVTFPLEVFTAVTGISGSGKSSLVSETLFPALSNRLQKSHLAVGKFQSIEGVEHLDKIIAIDQSPIGRTPRSNPATYIKVFDDIRDLFAALPESLAAGFLPGRFSFNVKEGSCPNCSGMGLIRIDMDFLEDDWTCCPICNGHRFDIQTLSVCFREKSIYDVLEMSVDEALQFFDAIPQIKKKLGLLSEVGLGYIKIGQSSTTLSGGEAQRIKLAKELLRPATGKTLYILDEPTTGLHFEDIKKLLAILQKLVDRKNSVLVIEHNMDLVKTADWVIDMGEKGGAGGGRVMAEGTPEEIAKKKSPTAPYLKQALEAKMPVLTGNVQRASPLEVITITGARENNLKNIDLEIPRGQITVLTGPSGSGKTSLAFDTLYSEGQRRYIDTLSGYVRQSVKQMQRPHVDDIQGLSPAICIEQKRHAGNPRSTIGTMTEIYDFLRVIYARLGSAYCPETGLPIKTISPETVVNHVMKLDEGTKIQVLAPLTLDYSEAFDTILEKLLKKGYLRIRLNQITYEIDEKKIPFDKNLQNRLELVIDRLIVKKGIEKRLQRAIEDAAREGKQTLYIATEKEDRYFNLSFAVEETGVSYPSLTPHTFSFNADDGMCMDCQGLGYQYGANLREHPQIEKLTLEQLLVFFMGSYEMEGTMDLFRALLKKLDIDERIPISTFIEKEKKILFEGKAQPIKIPGRKFSLVWKGLNALFLQLGRMASGELRYYLSPFLQTRECSACQGSRLNPLARRVELSGMTLPKLCSLPITKAHQELAKASKKYELTDMLVDLFKTTLSRFAFLDDIGLDYLSLNRAAPTLSGGETQRIRLARQLGSGLTGCLYVLDEPTIGLHPYNNEKLNRALLQLKALGNTLVLVEHDPMTLEIADHVVDFGPKAGSEGGRILARGSLEEIKRNPASLTGQYLSKALEIPPLSTKRTLKDFLTFKKIHKHHLKNVECSIPIGAITCITGVSGSGKSTLLDDVIVPTMRKLLDKRNKEPSTTLDGITISGHQAFDQIIALSQNPIGQTNRADVSTYTDLYTELRSFFAGLPEARAKGLLPRHFSFNHKKGMCKTCDGHGYQTVELQFLPPVKVLCESCRGHRLAPLSLSIKYRGNSIGRLLDYTIDEADEHLPLTPKIGRLLKMLQKVGLGYLKLGQEVATLSGGEAGRLRLARELVKQRAPKTLFCFDEPTTGLHFDDIRKLLPIFEHLALKKHTVVIIEHNLDIIVNADHVIDLSKEGKIVATGTPEEVAKNPASLTGQYLARKN